MPSQSGESAHTGLFAREVGRGRKALLGGDWWEVMACTCKTGSG